MRVIVCGSRTWTDRERIRRALATLPPGSTVIHGGQVTHDTHTGQKYGADYIADQEARALGLQVEVHRANWHAHGRAAGPMRNREMLISHNGVIHECWAFRMPGDSPGTDDMIRQAKAYGVTVAFHGGGEGG